ncbi:MAG TPA: 50S ribosomal protein L5 [Candidatus Saccharimonadales bacterium]|nr:50S ribosomal protein L5 [Candidatus Saccharimonadales bacterium]
MADLKKIYLTETKPKLQKDLKIKNPMAVPQLSKIVVNVGVRNAVGDKKGVPAVSDILGQITGQKPKVTKAKKSIAQFKLRQGDKIGVVVTMRGKRMYNFYDKLVNVVLPRIKDFHGVKKDSFDPRGNYTLGVIEYSVFPEIDTGKIDRIQGLEISIVTTARNKEEGQALLTALGMPFQK